MMKYTPKDDLMAKEIAGRSLEEQWDWLRKEKIQCKPVELRNKLMWALEIDEPKSRADNVILLGCYPVFRRPLATRNYFRLLKRFGIDATYLEDETCCGFIPILISRGKDRKRAIEASKELMESNLERVRKAGAKNAVYLCVWCAHLAKKFFPDSAIGQMHYPDILLDRLSKEKLRVEPKVIGYYEGCHQRSKQFALGVTLDWDSYRELLYNIEGLKVVKMPDHLCCAHDPELIINAAEGLNVDTILCSCYACDFRLRYVSKGKVRIQYYPDLLYEALKPE